MATRSSRGRSPSTRCCPGRRRTSCASTSAMLRGGRRGRVPRRPRLHAARASCSWSPSRRSTSRSGIDQDLFYGLQAAVAALVAMAVVRLGRRLRHRSCRSPLIAVAAFAAFLSLGANFLVVLAPAGWRLLAPAAPAARRWRRAVGVTRGGVLVLAASAAARASSSSWRGSRRACSRSAAPTPRCRCCRSSAVERHGWLTRGPVRRRPRDQRRPAGAADHLRRRSSATWPAGWAASLLMTLGVFLPAFVFPLFLHRAARRGVPGRAAAAVPARRDGRRGRADRRGHGRPARRERARRAERAARARRVRGALPRARGS